MAEKAQFAAELYAGRMPQGIDEAFRAGGASRHKTFSRFFERAEFHLGLCLHEPCLSSGTIRTGYLRGF